jgi:hypothetical protein
MDQVHAHKVKYFLNLCLHSSSNFSSFFFFLFSSTVCPAFPVGKVAATLLPFTTKVASRMIRLSLALNYCATPITCLPVAHLFLLITGNDNLNE